MSCVITSVYVDGMNLFYGCLKGSAYKWLDLLALSKALLPQDDVKTVRYFTAKVTSTRNDPSRHIRQHQYLRALATLPEVQIHLGHFRRDQVRMPVAYPPPNTIEVIKTKEKGSDVNLATYLMFDACQQACEKQLVITNDSDLAEPIRLVRRALRIPIGIANPHALRNRTSRLKGDFHRQIRDSTLAACQLPTLVKDSAGSFDKPPTW